MSDKGCEIVPAGQAADFGLLRKEKEPGFQVKVTRNRFVGKNEFGRPLAREESVQNFPSLPEAFGWALRERREGVNHLFEINIPFPVSASLDSSDVEERLVVSFDGRTGESPRSVENHHAVSTDHYSFFRICIEGCGSLFDRGLAWVDTTDSRTPVLIFNLLGGESLDREELMAQLSGLTQRVEGAMVDLLLGMNDDEN